MLLSNFPKLLGRMVLLLTAIVWLGACRHEQIAKSNLPKPLFAEGVTGLLKKAAGSDIVLEFSNSSAGGTSGTSFFGERSFSHNSSAEFSFAGDASAGRAALDRLTTVLTEHQASCGWERVDVTRDPDGHGLSARFVHSQAEGQLKIHMDFSDSSNCRGKIEASEKSL